MVETKIALLAYLIVTGANALVAYFLGWLATEWRRPLFNFKPFNCRPCLTFWLTFIISTYSYRALLLPSLWAAAGFAFVLGIVMFIHLKTQYKIV